MQNSPYPNRTVVSLRTHHLKSIVGIQCSVSEFAQKSAFPIQWPLVIVYSHSIECTDRFELKSKPEKPGSTMGLSVVQLLWPMILTGVRSFRFVTIRLLELREKVKVRDWMEIEKGLISIGKCYYGKRVSDILIAFKHYYYYS